jgi:Protein of unknown function (DUF3047)
MSRGTVLLLIGLGSAVWAAGTAWHGGVAALPETLVVEDWSEQPLGHAGIPVGWQGQSWGRPKYDFRIVKGTGADDAGKILHLLSDGDNSIISKRAGRIDVRQHPVLEWRWRVVTLPVGGDSRKAATDDQAGQVYVVFPRWPTAVRSRIIGYVWDTTAPAGAIVPSPSASAVTYVVVRSGEAELGRWITERRNVREDFKRIYGEEPDAPIEVVSIGIDSNDTRSRAESYLGAILFRARSAAAAVGDGGRAGIVAAC